MFCFFFKEEAAVGVGLGVRRGVLRPLQFNNPSGSQRRETGNPSRSGRGITRELKRAVGGKSVEIGGRRVAYKKRTSNNTEQEK